MRSGVKVVLLTIDIHDIVSVAEQLQGVHVVVVYGARTSPSLDQLTPNAKERIVVQVDAHAAADESVTCGDFADTCKKRCFEMKPLQ